MSLSETIGSILRKYPVLIGLISVCVAIELVLVAADIGLLGGSRLRATTYEYAGFWPGLLGDWEPNYSVQPALMFFTYGFLHGSFMHLLVNMITLWTMGCLVIDRVGQRRFALLYAAAIGGGGLGFALLSSGFTPMVGASGAIFGVIGGLLSWSYVDLFALKERLWPVVRGVLFLLALNLVLWWAMDGLLAWQTHLGGFVFGWVVALMIDPTPKDLEG